MISASAGVPPSCALKRLSPIVPAWTVDTGSTHDFDGRFSETATRIQLCGKPGFAASNPGHERTPGSAQGSPPLAPGCELGAFRLVEALGRGAQGDVWKAQRLAPVEQLVALKVLKPNLARHPARMAQFRHEAARGPRLAGPSLLAAWELKESHGYHFLTMPYVEGTTLRDVIKWRRAFLRGDEVEGRHPFVNLEASGYLFAMAGVLAEAAAALARVHEQHIAHRDVKPANILVDNSSFGRVYLCDFGLGRDLEVATPEQMRDGSGTPMYMAPERLLLFTADEIRCDIYSMGVTACEALTLERPFRVPDHVGVSGLATFLARAEPRRPRLLDPDLPEELEAIIMKAMARDPRQRHDSARELARDLEQFAELGSLPSQLPSAHPASTPRLPRPHSLVKRGVADHANDHGPHRDAAL